MKLLLKRHAFSDEYVAAIREQIPSQFHVMETYKQTIKKPLPDVLAILYGSKQTCGNREVIVKLTHASSGGFHVKVAKLREFLMSFMSFMPLMPFMPFMPPMPPMKGSNMCNLLPLEENLDNRLADTNKPSL